MDVQRADAASDDLHELWDHALKRLKSHRGGAELYSTIRRDVDDDALLDDVIDSGALWTIRDDERVLGFALVPQRTNFEDSGKMRSNG